MKVSELIIELTKFLAAGDTEVRIDNCDEDLEPTGEIVIKPVRDHSFGRSRVAAYIMTSFVRSQ